ncbi:MAG: hypothetical protein WAR22_10285 [Desulfomonilia bacterium]|jgi:mono/diheme cytochrome c family protein
MKNPIVTFLAITGCLLFLVLSIPSPEAPRAQQRGDPPVIVMAECTVCHTTKRICDDLGDEDLDDWVETVSEMVSKGAKLSKDEIPLIAEYLWSLKPGSAPVCR